ncbi:hypothetical protein H696_05253 [Fonticula alba]|uniref:Amino acid transporter transmembrane domain-containing protein n=1 Tax=Fonticula alba TaxID=691883 RepID=A0A058Z2H0_FONAL|nr:hypothetical protein H696_05253 [Fonticula alba]KCV68336.1 hypothetical protein H696_05253 [Fonticula alba]|eukprot:XP_009497390.1 hypothetical protein H696_05253 [Fonticula alba]
MSGRRRKQKNRSRPATADPSVPEVAVAAPVDEDIAVAVDSQDGIIEDDSIVLDEGDDVADGPAEVDNSPEPVVSEVVLQGADVPATIEPMPEAIVPEVVPIEPALEAAVEPVIELASPPVAEVTVEPVAEVTVEPVAEVTVEPVAEVSVEPVAEVSVEPVAEVSVEPVPEIASLISPEAAPTPMADILSPVAPEPVEVPQTITFIGAIPGSVPPRLSEASTIVSRSSEALSMASRASEASVGGVPPALASVRLRPAGDQTADIVVPALEAPPNAGSAGARRIVVPTSHIPSLNADPDFNATYVDPVESEPASPAGDDSPKDRSSYVVDTSHSLNSGGAADEADGPSGERTSLLGNNAVPFSASRISGTTGPVVDTKTALEQEALRRNAIEAAEKGLDEEADADSPEGKQSSVTTIFSIWNTMIGSSLLSMPWALNQSGWLMGLFTMLVMVSICTYTALLIVRHDHGNGRRGVVVDFADLAAMYFGKWGARAAAISSIGVFWGATFAYGILMSGFLYNLGDQIAYWVNGLGIEDTPLAPYWTPEYVAIFLLILIFPLTLIKNFSFFARFTSLGTISVIYMIGFVAYWAISSGFVYGNATLFTGKFYYFSGVLTLSFYIHNAILSIMRNQRNPENNARDLSIAYVLVFFSYLAVAFLFYFCVEDKSKIYDNLLRNIQEIAPGNGGLFVAQLLLLFQMITIFPLIAYIIRFQFMSFVYNNPYPSTFKVLAVHVILSATCILMAVFYPNVGDVLRFSGAFFGMIAVYMLPIGFEVMEKKRQGLLTKTSIVVHCALIAIGVANFVAQFF